MPRSLKKRKYALHFPEGEGRTEQSHAGETDINQIMAKARRGESSNYINQHQPHYGVATPIDFAQAQIIIATGNSMFEDLPSKLRSRFNHNPAEFLEFVQDPKNDEECYTLNLKNRPQDTALPEDTQQSTDTTQEESIPAESAPT